MRTPIFRKLHIFGEKEKHTVDSEDSADSVGDTFASTTVETSARFVLTANSVNAPVYVLHAYGKAHPLPHNQNGSADLNGRIAEYRLRVQHVKRKHPAPIGNCAHHCTCCTDQSAHRVGLEPIRAAHIVIYGPGSADGLGSRMLMFSTRVKGFTSARQLHRTTQGGAWDCRVTLQE